MCECETILWLLIKVCHQTIRPRPLGWYREVPVLLLFFFLKHCYWENNRDPKLTPIFDCHFLDRWTSALCALFTLWTKCLAVQTYLIRHPRWGCSRNNIVACVLFIQVFNYLRTCAFMFPGLRNESVFGFLIHLYAKAYKNTCCCGAVCSIIR